MRLVFLVMIGVVPLALLGCAEPQQTARSAADSPHAGRCPTTTTEEGLPAGTTPEQATLDYWLGRYSAQELDAPLLSTEGVADYNSAVGRRPGGDLFSQRDLLEAPDLTSLQHDVAERLSFLRAQIESGEYVGAEDMRLGPEALSPFDKVLGPITPDIRVALADVPIRCGPYPAGLFKPKSDIPYDRNACSTAHAQEPLQVLSTWEGAGGMRLVRTRYALGFIGPDAALSPPLSSELAARVVRGPHATTTEALELDAEGTQVALPPHTRVAANDAAGTVLVATAQGVVEVPRPSAISPARRSLTRRALFTTAFSFLNAPYGFGGAEGGRDCSRLLLDIFESFDVALPRHSGWQAQAGNFRVDVSKMSEAEKLRALDQASKRGAVLLHFPGHIMLYLGDNEAGEPMALHALGEYARPCAGGKGESVVDVRRTVVSDLSLGRGSSRTSFLERLTTLVVIGSDEPPAALAKFAQRHAPPPPQVPGEDVACADSVEARIFVSPQRPLAGRELRVIATTSQAAGDAQLWLFDPEGEQVAATPRKLGGPPYSAWMRVPEAQTGRYTAVWMQGNEMLACKRLAVRKGAPEPSAAPDGPVWEPRFRWERDTQNLWAAFVEQLFDYPPEDGRTWQNLHTLLRDPERNLLFDHLGRGEDGDIELVPDCADLPYVLRAYFSWKLALPFAYRQCSRGRTGVPPTCGPLRDNLTPREYNDDVRAFDRFVNRNVRSGVHSASGRTHPEDDATDLYPVGLERASLPPGTVFADPYGHVMMLTKWFPQGRTGPDSYGILMAAEAQPDSTVGRRRFFRGAFLFDPSTDDVGAGFKQFRPLVYDRQQGTISALTNEELANQSDFPPFSMQQYGGSREDFYMRVEALIDPEPLDPHARLTSLVDAFEESVRRRVIAVANGERYMKENGMPTVAMPVGHDVFETTGPWEDYSTPSRDLRLLISLDSVTSFPATVRKYPERFKLSGPEHAKRVAAQLESDLARQLGERRIEYVRSDGSIQALTLADVLDRAQALELAYNPNDCIELRWGAPEGSPERATCKRRAPAEQQKRMTRYRVWFSTRTRPHRGAVNP